MTDTRLGLKTRVGHANRIAHNGLSMAPMADLRGHKPKTCAFIAGEDHYACGEPTLTGKSYCATHHARCHTTVSEPFIPGKSKGA